MERERRLFLEGNSQIRGDQSRFLLREAKAQRAELSSAPPGGRDSAGGHYRLAAHTQRGEDLFTPHRRRLLRVAVRIRHVDSIHPKLVLNCGEAVDLNNPPIVPIGRLASRPRSENDGSLNQQRRRGSEATAHESRRGPAVM